MQSIVTLRDVSFELPNGRSLFSQLNFSLSNSITALVGINGVGKTCLANLIAERLQPTTGKIQRNAAISYFNQRETPPEISVAEYLLPKYQWNLFGEELLKGILQEEVCSNLSGGQWTRVRLTNSIQDSYLILDEPTNDLDREGREALLRFLKSRKGGTLLIHQARETHSPRYRTGPSRRDA